MNNRNEEEVRVMVALNVEDEKKLQQCYKEEEKIKKRLKERKGVLFRICTHDFVRYDDAWRCNKCCCYRDKYMYQ